MPTPRHGMGAVAMNGVIYVIGGSAFPGLFPSRVNEAFTPP
jgi:Kelch motif protein